MTAAPTWLWAAFTLTAAGGQTLRNALQHDLTEAIGAAGATFVRFLFGLPFSLAFLAADSETKARKALCASDKAQAWNDLLLRNKQADNAGTCDTSLEEVRALSQKLGISGTPVVFFESGKRLQGYEPPERFNKRLADNSKG